MANLRELRNELRTRLQRFEKKWLLENPPFKEAAIEAALLQEMFRHPLFGFNEESAKHQYHPVPKQRDRADVVLRLAGKTRVVVEIKQVSKLNDRNKCREALKEAERYIVYLEQKYGIVTDGYTWIYILVEPIGKYHRIRQLVRFHIAEDQRLALRILERSKRATLKRLLEMLRATNGAMTEKIFNNLKDQSLRDRITTLINLAKTGNVTVTAADRTILREIYRGKRIDEMVKPALTPLRLTRKMN